MNKKQIFNRILIALILSSILMGCDSSDDTKEDGISKERTKIIMEIPSQGNLDNYNWNNAKLVWSQEFDDNASFNENWVFDTIYSASDHLQIYKEENLEVSNGKLKIRAKRTGAGQNKGDYTSSRVSSKYAFQHGRIEIRAKLPAGEKPGLNVHISLIGENGWWPDSGIINIMEYFSHKPNETFITIHSAANNENNANLISGNTTLETAEEEFHAYGILWTSNYIKFYIDDPENIFYVLDRPSNATDFNWPFDKAFYLVTGMVVGGEHAGFEGVDDSMFPAVMEIDYIRVYHAL